MKPSGYWIPTLSSRGELYYTGEMLTKEDREELVEVANHIKSIIPCEDKIKDNYSFHMCSGSPTKKIGENIHIVDLSVLKMLPEGNTSWTAFLLAEQFIQDYVVNGRHVLQK